MAIEPGRKQPSASPLDRFLRLFADVHPGEGLTATLLALNIFLLLTAYYILKPVREALILGQGSAELKSYMSAGMVVVLAIVVPLYGNFASRVHPPPIDQCRDHPLCGLPRLVLRPCPTGRAVGDGVLRLDRRV